MSIVRQVVSFGGGDISSSSILVADAGETLGQYLAVYGADDGKYYLADANKTIIEADAVAIVVDAGGIAEGDTGLIHIEPGFVDNPTWTWTPHESLFLGEDGLLTTDPSTLAFVKPIGYAETATRIYWNPQTGWANNPWFEVEADQLQIGYIPTDYTRTLAPNCTATDQLAAHLAGINAEIAAIKAQL